VLFRSVLVKFVPEFGVIAIWGSVILFLAATAYLVSHAKKVHDELVKVGL
jgi:hypothetical protein